MADTDYALATTKKKLPGDPLNPDATTNGLLGAGAGGAAPPVGEDPNAALTNTSPVGDPRRGVDGPLAAGAGGAAPPVGVEATTQAPAADMTPQEAAAAGLGWVDKYNSNYGKPGFVGPQTAPATAPVGVTGDPQRPGLLGAGAGGAAPPVGAGGDLTGGSVPVGGATAQGQPTSIAQSFQQAMVNKLNPAAVDVNNAAIAPSINANRLAEQRGTELQHNAMAEQAARSGTSMSGGNDSLQRGILADSATRQGQFAGNAVQHVADQQNADIMAALGLSGNYLQADAARQQQESQFGRSLGEQTAGRVQQGGQFDRSLAEQKRSADVDAELRRLGINTQGSLGQGDLALRGRLGDQQGNLGLLGLLMSNDQFGRSLGQNASQFGAGLDQSGLLGLLGLLR